MKQCDAKPVAPAGLPKDSTTRLIRITEVRAITGLSRSYIYELANKEVFPKSVSLVPGGTSRAWVETEIHQWVADRLSARYSGGVQ
jgi:prophage regulatory protein